jgi:hypothetical protein
LDLISAVVIRPFNPISALALAAVPFPEVGSIDLKKKMNCSLVLFETPGAERNVRKVWVILASKTSIVVELTNRTRIFGKNQKGSQFSGCP